uniref:Uncharacterized protein n=1 Tax=Aegilops tauschii subsp. strangulata TaxID=200361 RepID=A0A453NKZ6_AEGTS
MHCRGHDPSRPSSRAHAHPRSGPKRRSKAPSEEGELDTTTPIQSPKPRRRSTQPRQAAAELDPVAGHRFRGSTIGSANPPPPRASTATRSPCAAVPQPADEREAAHGRDGLGNRIVQLLQIGGGHIDEGEERDGVNGTNAMGWEGGGGSEGLVVCAGATDRKKSRKKREPDPLTSSRMSRKLQ